jgi:hypothetical protein
MTSKIRSPGTTTPIPAGILLSGPQLRSDASVADGSPDHAPAYTPSSAGLDHRIAAVVLLWINKIPHCNHLALKNRRAA